MRYPEVECTVLGEPILAPNRNPEAVLIGKSCRTVCVVSRRLVVGNAHLDRPGIVVAVDRAYTDAPSVLEVFRGRAERCAIVAHDLQLLELRPAGPSHISHQRPT